MRSHSLTRASAVKRAFSLFCLGLFFYLQLLATLPELHRLVHHDADKDDHHCAVTLLAQGKINLADTGVPPLMPQVFVFENPPLPVSILIAVDYQLLPGRGPPSLLS